MIKHYLITVSTNSDIRSHAYVMCDLDKFTIEKVYNVMLDKLEELGLMPSSIILQTALCDSVNIVRDMISEGNPKVQKLLKEATDFHCTAWLAQVDSPDDLVLMKIH